VANLSPVPLEEYVVGPAATGRWRELVNTDAALRRLGRRANWRQRARRRPGYSCQPHSAKLTLPPLGASGSSRG
jgi:1,4-alpha-glucan branching enzyme